MATIHIVISESAAGAQNWGLCSHYGREKFYGFLSGSSGNWTEGGVLVGCNASAARSLPVGRVEEEHVDRMTQIFQSNKPDNNNPNYDSHVWVIQFLYRLMNAKILDYSDDIYNEAWDLIHEDDKTGSYVRIPPSELDYLYRELEGSDEPDEDDSDRAGYFESDIESNRGIGARSGNYGNGFGRRGPIPFDYAAGYNFGPRMNSGDNDHPGYYGGRGHLPYHHPDNYRSNRGRYNNGSYGHGICGCGNCIRGGYGYGDLYPGLPPRNWR